jgi:hypothetical protein
MIKFEIILIIFFLLFGILNNFFGYKFFKFLLSLLGFIIGFFLVWKYLNTLIGNEMVTLVIAVIAGITAGALLYFFYFAGFFITGACFGAIIGFSLNIPFDYISKIGIILIISIACGILSLIFQKFMVIISTSFGGAYMLVNSLFYGYFYFSKTNYSFNNYLTYMFSNKTIYFIVIILTIIIGLIGIYFQYQNSDGEIA